MIRMALLLGSDYTDGVKGVGIVNASEVLRAFPEDSGLAEFREWVNTVDEEDFKQKQRKKRKESGNSATGDAKERFKSAHRTQRRKWNVPPNFPNGQVLAAYRKPRVDDDSTPFEFKPVNFAGLRVYCSTKLGWALDHIDELLLPVIKVQSDRRSQRRIDSYMLKYSDNVLAANIRSKRLKAAVHGLSKDDGEGSGAAAPTDASPAPCVAPGSIGAGAGAGPVDSGAGFLVADDDNAPV